MVYYTRIFDSKTQQQIGNMVDITTQGIMLVSSEPVPVQTNFQLKLELSDDIADKPFLELETRSVWCHHDIDPNYYNSGFQILSPTSEDMDIIQRIIEAYGIRDNLLNSYKEKGQ